MLIWWWHMVASLHNRPIFIVINLIAKELFEKLLIDTAVYWVEHGWKLQ